MKLIQFNMFNEEPTVVRTFTSRETKPFNHAEWHAQQNGQWEIATAQRRMARDVKANDAQTEPVI